MTGAQLNSRRGVTLFEFIAVIAILAILGSIAYAAIPAAFERQRIGKAKSELSVVAASLEQYRARYGSYPRRPSSFEDPVTDMEQYLFNALNGKFAPDGTPILGKALLNNSVLQLETSNYPNPESSAAVDNRIVDPWENPYRYDYDPAKAGGWTEHGYILYSAGPDGKYETENDNVYAK